MPSCLPGRLYITDRATLQFLALTRILFVKPRRSYAENQVTPPMGPLCLAAYVREHRPSIEPRILDLGLHADGKTALAQEIATFRPDVIGVSALTVESLDASTAAINARRAGFDGPVIFGGPHASSDPHGSARLTGIDYVVVGEGERTLVELLDALEAGSDPGSVAGLAFMRGGEVVQTPARPFMEELDSLPFPAWDLVDVHEYSRRYKFSKMIAQPPYAVVFSSRACPYRCIYCHHNFGKKFHAQSPERVLAEIDHLVNRFGVRELEFWDDIFNLDRARAARILDLIAERRYDLKLAFPNGLRGDLMNDELVEKFAAAGTYYVAYAIESGSERMQKLIKKHVNLARLTEVIDKTVRHGIFTHGFFILGFPTESEDEMRMTVEYALTSKLHTAGFFVANPYPGTELTEVAMDLGLDAAPDPARLDYLDVGYNLSATSTEVLRSLKNLAYRRFYLSPSRLARIMRDFPNKRALTALFPRYAAFFLRRVASVGMAA